MVLSSHERDLLLARRPWQRAERRVVARGVLGRALIAIEPIICALVFIVLAVGMVMLRGAEQAWVFGPIFGLAAVAFFIYAAVVLIEPMRALMQTFAPIYIVDGYVRYRRPDLDSDPHSSGYIAVLNEERRQLCEWPLFGCNVVVDTTVPAMVEFTHYGGVHRIDGQLTGILPDSLEPLGIGMFKPEITDRPRPNRSYNDY